MRNQKRRTVIFTKNKPKAKKSANVVITRIHRKTTNRVYAAHDATFKKCCELAHIPATSRQASKYRNKLGLAYSVKNQITESIT